MSYRPRELVVRAREAAGVLLATLDHNEMVQRFLDMYAAEFRRPGRADQPGHYREQMETIRRESILVMALRIEGALPTHLKVRVPVRAAKSSKKRKKGKKKSRAKKTIKPAWDLAIPLLDLFREEFFVALGQALTVDRSGRSRVLARSRCLSIVVWTGAAAASEKENARQRIWPICGSRGTLARPFADGASAPRGGKIPDGTPRGG